ncbi:hypothetical protein Bbelb_096610 [Branchiostoma belcheri]|nr:hypothetical protein Bbelb_096610 [Branchiostoma belcheri]
MPRQKALPRDVSLQAEDPAYVTPNDARGEPVYINPSGDLADAQNVIYERAADASEDEPEYLTLKDDSGDKGSEQPPVEADVLAAGDSGILKRLYQRMTGFRTLSITLCLMYLVNSALVIYITGESTCPWSSTSQVSQPGPGHLHHRCGFLRFSLPVASEVCRLQNEPDEVNLALVMYITAAGYQPSSQAARQPSRAEEILTVPKEVLPLLKFLAGELGGTGETWQLPGKTWQRPGGGEANASREPPTTPNSLKDPPFRTATFTTLGATGRAGPTSLGAHYRGQDHEKLVTLQDGIQLFTVPETGDYRIEVAGAAGGWDSFSGNKDNRGYGAMMRGNFELHKGEVLKILIGQETVTKGGMSSGGGGGTFVARFNNTPLIIAGGGGGMQWLFRQYASCDGTTLTSGQRSYLGVKSRVGNVSNEVNAGGSEGHGATDGKGTLGGGGGGFYTNGGSGRQFGTRGSGKKGGEGGYAFVNGGKGGRGTGYNTEGGFGGGGGAYAIGMGSGGGGGYSGGGKGTSGLCECGGGGGSFNAGTDASGRNGKNDGPGYAVIVRLFD